MAEWIARVYRNGARFRVVVEGLLQFDADQLDGIDERTAAEIVEHLRRFFPKRAPPIEDPTAVRVLTLSIAVASDTTD
jgi:hypothetical protein